MTPNKKKSEICVCGHYKGAHNIRTNPQCFNCSCSSFRPPQADMKDVLLAGRECKNHGANPVQSRMGWFCGGVEGCGKDCAAPQPQSGEEKRICGNPKCGQPLSSHEKRFCNNSHCEFQPQVSESGENWEKRDWFIKSERTGLVFAHGKLSDDDIAYLRSLLSRQTALIDELRTKLKRYEDKTI